MAALSALAGDMAGATGIHALLELLLVYAVAVVIAYLPTWLIVKWFLHWRFFRRPASQLPPPGKRGTIEGTVLAADETIPAPHDPTIECVAWHLWEYDGSTTHTYSRVRPLLLDTPFGRIHLTVDDRWWHPSLAWNDAFSTADHRAHHTHMRVSISRAKREQFPDRTFDYDEEIERIDFVKPRLMMARPGDTITVSGVFTTEEPAGQVSGYRGVSPGELRLIVTPGPSIRRVVITPEYATTLAFMSPFQRRFLFFCSLTAFALAFLIVPVLWMAGFRSP